MVNASFIQDIEGLFANDTVLDAAYQNYCSNITKHQWDKHWELLDIFAWWFEGVGLVFVACYGLVLNCLAITILSTKKLSSFFNLLLAWLAVFDTLFLFFSMLYHIAVFQPNILHHYWTTTLFVYAISPFRSMVMLCSIYMTVALSYDRYKAVSNPTEYKINERMASSDACGAAIRTVKYVGGVMAFSIFFYLPKFFDLEISEDEKYCSIEYMEQEEYTLNATNCTYLEYSIKGTDLRNNDKFVLWYVNVANFIVTVAIPLISLTYLNIRIYSKVKLFLKRRPSTFADNLSNAARERSKDIQQAYQLFGIVFLFVLCHLLRVSLNIEEFINMNKSMLVENKFKCELPRDWSRAILPPISHFLLQFNSSTNFFVYCFFNKTFRIILKEKFVELLAMCCPSIIHCSFANANGGAAVKTSRTEKVRMSNIMLKVPEDRIAENEGDSEIIPNNSHSQGPFHEIPTIDDRKPTAQL